MITFCEKTVQDFLVVFRRGISAEYQKCGMVSATPHESKQRGNKSALQKTSVVVVSS